MNSNNNQVSRRAALKSLAAIPVVAVTAYAGGLSAEMVSPEDKTAKALAYTEQSPEEGKNCANCNLYQGGDAASGPCLLFPGKDVAAAGWCKSWVAKP